MKFTIDKDVLVDALNMVKGVTDKKQVSPILSNALVESIDNKLSFLTTSVEIGVKILVEANILEAGKTTIPVRNFYDICKEMPKGQIEVNANNEEISIISGKINFKIPTLPFEDFPEVSIPKKVSGKTFESKDIEKMFNTVSFCSSTDETKYYLNSVLIDKSEMGLRFVSTDAHKLGVIDSGVAKIEEISDGEKVLIPRRGFNELTKILNKHEKVNMWIERPNIYITDPELNTVLFMNEINRDYPNYERVIPDDSKKIFKLSSKDIVAAIKRVSLVSTSTVKTVKFNVSGNNLVLSSESSEYGTAVEEIEIENLGIDFNDVIFNAKYLIDIVEHADSESVIFESGEDFGPFLIKPSVTNENSELRYVLMPMDR